MNIKSKMLIGLSVCFFMGVTQASALPLIDRDTVGLDDTLIGMATFSPTNPAAEVNWVNTVLGLTGPDAFQTTELLKTESTHTDWVRWYQVENEEVYAFEFLTFQPEYFLIKTGGSNVSTYDHYLFRNIQDLGFGVVNLELQLGGEIAEIKNFTAISHIGELGTTPIPEPTTLLLFGTGLLGLAGLARRKRN